MSLSATLIPRCLLVVSITGERPKPSELFTMIEVGLVILGSWLGTSSNHPAMIGTNGHLEMKLTWKWTTLGLIEVHAAVQSGCVYRLYQSTRLLL